MPFSVLLSVCTISWCCDLSGPCGQSGITQVFETFLTDQEVVVCLVYVVLSGACLLLCSGLYQEGNLSEGFVACLALVLGRANVKFYNFS